ncbi:MAG: aldo/keto reductase [Hyphomonadaceae bacterium]
MTVETRELAPGYRISRVIRGGWQLAGDHGAVDRDRAVADMRAFLDAGIIAFDGADIYTGVEEMYGAFRATLSPADRARLKVHTKFVPDWDALARCDGAYVRGVIERSLMRLRAERLDLVQFHWWNYDVPGMAEAALELRALQREGKIDLIGGTNFDTPAVRALLEAGVSVKSLQIQYSLLDRRPAHGLAEFCAGRGVSLLCYGALAGGFLTERWLDAPAPSEITNRSLIKYRLIIDEFGGWDAFQALLRALAAIARRHGVSIGAVATRWVLDQPGVAAAIVGARYADRLDETLGVFRFTLDSEDHAALDALLAAHPGPPGDTYALERDRNGPHGRIMKYNLNAA